MLFSQYLSLFYRFLQFRNFRLNLNTMEDLSIHSEKKIFNMANIQNSLAVQFEDLPDEMILKILENLDMKSLANCVTVSKRIRAICKDVTTFQKINLFRREVPTGFLQLVLNSGCKYLCLSEAKMLPEASGLCLNSPSKLIYLDLSFKFNGRYFSSFWP